MKQLQDVLDTHSLKRQGLSQRRIAIKPGIHRQTMKKYLDHPKLVQQVNRRKPRVSKLDPKDTPVQLLPVGFFIQLILIKMQDRLFGQIDTLLLHFISVQLIYQYPLISDLIIIIFKISTYVWEFK